MHTATLDYGQAALADPHQRSTDHRQRAGLYVDFDRLVERLDSGLALLYPDPPSWKSLMARSMNGDRRAYRVLLEEFQEFLEMYFSRQASDDVAMQMVHSTLLAAHRKLSSCDPKVPILPWLLALADYCAGSTRAEATAH